MQSVVFLNAPPAYSVLFQKVDGESGEALGGAAFQVYRVNADGAREYIAYHGRPYPGSVMLPYHTPDAALAHTFYTNNYDKENTMYGPPAMYQVGAFLVPGLSPGHTYHLKEVVTPAGYLPAKEDLAFSQAQAIDYDAMGGELLPVRLGNQRAEGVTLFRKLAFVDRRPDAMTSFPMVGIRFALMETRIEEHEEGYLTMLVRLATEGGTPGQAPVFGDWFDLNEDDYGYLEFCEAMGVAPTLEGFFEYLGAQMYTTDAAGNLAIYELPEETQLELMELNMPQWASPVWGDRFIISDGEVLPEREPWDGLPALPTISNRVYTNNLQIFKTDPSGLHGLKGARFRVAVALEGEDDGVPMYVSSAPPSRFDNEPDYMYEFTTDPAEARIFETDAEGRAMVALLRSSGGAGRLYHYTLQEVSPPNGYLSSGSSEYSFAFDTSHLFHYNGSELRNVINVPIPPIPLQVSASKQLMDREGNELSLADFPPFTFDLYYKDRLLGSAQSDAEGQIRFPLMYLDPTTISWEELRQPVALTLIERLPVQPVEGMRYDTAPRTLRGRFIGQPLSPKEVSQQGRTARAFRAEALPALSAPAQPVPQAEHALYRGQASGASSMRASGPEFDNFVITLALEEAELRFKNVFVKPAEETEPPTPTETDPPAPTPESTGTKPPAATQPPAPVYQAISVPLIAKKQLSGRTLKAEEFEFVLKDYPGNVLEVVKNGADGSISFSPRVFSRSGTFLYTMEEVKGQGRSLHYDATRYTARIRVSESGGALHAQVDYFKDGVPFGGEILFYNRYLPPATGDSAPQRTLLMSLGALLLAGLGLYLRRRSTGRP